jgi:hypothetical protein
MLSSLDISNNPKLTDLWCSVNQLTSLDVSKNIAIKDLLCGGNELASLDVSNNTVLEWLSCWQNGLTNLDVSNNPQLTELWCDGNMLTSLDVSNNPELTVLWCNSNQLASLDVSSNIALEGLDCSDNQLTSLDVSNNLALRGLECGTNQISSLDLSKNIDLIYDIWFLQDLDISFMPSLNKVCVWTWPFPPDEFDLNMEGSPNAYFSVDCEDMIAPVIYITEVSLYQPEIIKAISTEDGVIYLVPENTSRNLYEISESCLDSVPVLAQETVNLTTADLSNGNYWLYARDHANNISDPKEFTINGVGMVRLFYDDVMIYPNPVDEIITILINRPGKYIIELISLNGQQLVIHESSGPFHQVDLSPFGKGIYFITVRSQDFVSTGKIVKK